MNNATQDPRWAAIVARDPSADRHFVYAVKTTGIYGRPSSLARLPRPENVEFFDSPEAAEAAGYRPSRRAAADRSALSAQHAALVAEACRCIEEADSPHALGDLAARMGMSPFHFHRIFKQATGLTPRAFSEAHRAQRLREQLRRPQTTVTEALHEVGFGSSSRFYEASRKVLGMQPREFQSGGVNHTIRFAVGECSLGAILVAQSERGVCAIALGEDPERLVHELQDQFPKATLLGADTDFEQAVAQVIGFVEDPSQGLDLPLDVRGTAFQERVWQALRAIPPGVTLSYSELARRIGQPKAIRAVASACASNRIAVAVPCHRVVRNDGDLAGYRWGVERKRALLSREGS